ncbi:hypothetical protein NX02_19935 [Sphingomonas sanxanigenens DSM 19645 = NX02]|uniref:Uncharacterized protein n=1 Tax=Sphingomonas sanxanigenens DSM 19645 = NX02 TaxID=1123269 RepID=W0AEW8_9SPHN|nr:hypothetical protein NX02_19935 [Sphingomonas sanxanigenens DSM 19645 = NX02]
MARATQAHAGSNDPAGDAFSRLVDAKSDTRAFGFSEFGMFGLHAVRRPGSEALASAPAEASPQVDDARSAQMAVWERAGEPLPSFDSRQASVAVAATTAPSNIVHRERPVATAPLVIDVAPQSPTRSAMQGPDVSDGDGAAVTARSRPTGRTAEHLPFSIAFDPATGSISISLFAHGGGNALREHVRRRIRSIAAEFGTNITDVRMNGQLLPVAPPFQRS